MSIHEEWHVTVEGDPWKWRQLCDTLRGFKPLWIELNTFERQLMSASAFDPRSIRNAYGIPLIEAAGFKIIRVKHEIQPTVVSIDITTQGEERKYYSRPVPEPNTVLYYECHVKIDGTFNPALPLASRDLFRSDRWYVTKRQLEPFSGQEFHDAVRIALAHMNTPVRASKYEYEAAVLDTYPRLDAEWMALAQTAVRNAL
jgi:hypothetical protein